MRKTMMSSMVLGSVLASTSALAANDVYYDKARVVDYTPNTRLVHVPDLQEECWFERVQVPGRYDSATPTIIGGIAGGVIGNQFGGGRGNVVSTIAGTLLGGSIGRDVGRSQARPRTITERRCEVVDYGFTEERVSGYTVTYEYEDQLQTIQMPTKPGKYIDVRVNKTVTPVTGY